MIKFLKILLINFKILGPFSDIVRYIIIMRIFGDAIDDKIFPKKIKRFTQEEKNLIEKFVNSILRNDKYSELENSEINQFNDRLDGITEEIHKYFI